MTERTIVIACPGCSDPLCKCLGPTERTIRGVIEWCNAGGFLRRHYWVWSGTSFRCCNCGAAQRGEPLDA